jgi:hypothetical protein
MAQSLGFCIVRRLKETPHWKAVYNCCLQLNTTKKKREKKFNDFLNSEFLEV